MPYELKLGKEFTSATYELDTATISKYLEAVEESSGMYPAPILEGKTLVPPMAIATYALRALSESLSLLTGSIHVSQEIEFLKPVPVGSRITCHGKVAQLRSRGNICLVSIEISALNQKEEEVLWGKITFVIPG